MTDKNTRLQLLQAIIGQSTSHYASPFTKWLHPVLLAAEYGELTIKFTVRNEMLNSANILHGGVTAAILDDVIGTTMYTCGEEDSYYVTVNNVIDYFVSAIEGETLIVKTKLIKKGSKLSNLQGEVWNEDQTRLYSRGSSTMMRLLFADKR